MKKLPNYLSKQLPFFYAFEDYMRSELIALKVVPQNDLAGLVVQFYYYFKDEAKSYAESNGDFAQIFQASRQFTQRLIDYFKAIGKLPDTAERSEWLNPVLSILASLRGGAVQQTSTVQNEKMDYTPIILIGSALIVVLILVLKK